MGYVLKTTSWLQRQSCACNKQARSGKHPDWSTPQHASRAVQAHKCWCGLDSGGVRYKGGLPAAPAARTETLFCSGLPMRMRALLLVACALAASAAGQKNPNWWGGRNTIVHLFEWKFSDIASECENYLAPNGFAGVQIKGSLTVYVDVVFNDMAANWPNAVGYGGSTADTYNLMYPGVPYGPGNFHPICEITSYSDANLVMNIIVDAAKHMWPADLEYIYSQVKNLNTQWFASNTRPFFYQEVIDQSGNEGVHSYEYTSFGVVTEFKYGSMLSSAFQGNNAIKYLKNWGPEWGLLDGASALAFIDNHDNQRGSGGGGDVLTYKTAKLYKMAIAFMLAWPYGITRVISSYYFTNTDAGPPSNSDGTIKDVYVNGDGTCSNGWVCEHRWREVLNMVAFKNTVEGTTVANWWDNGDMQIAFSRGNAGFIAFNDQYNTDFKQTLQTGLPRGTYCDLISGYKQNGSCSGKSVTVNEDGTAYIQILSSEDNGMLAISSASKVN
ncbi:Alpha-amylase [Gryllus bimaculatus]|nr:Alpha-amylase [Gryllus bimaculatus]